MNNYLKNDTTALKLEVLNVLRIGVYQKLFMYRIPNYAIVNILKSSKYKGYAGFVNAVLNSIIRDIKGNKFQIGAIDADAQKFKLSINHSHPLWLVSLLILQFGIEEAEQILIHNNMHPLLAVRINRARASNAEIENYFFENNILWKYNSSDKCCIIIEKSPINIASTEIFISGKIYYSRYECNAMCIANTGTFRGFDN